MVKPPLVKIKFLSRLIVSLPIRDRQEMEKPENYFSLLFKAFMRTSSGSVTKLQNDACSLTDASPRAMKKNTGSYEVGPILILKSPELEGSRREKSRIGWCLPKRAARVERAEYIRKHVITA
jgi:hypothetical protein